MSDPKTSSQGKVSLSVGSLSSTDKAKAAKKKWIYAGVGVFLVILLASAMSGKKDLTPTAAEERAKREAAVIDLTPKDVNKQGWQAQSQADITALIKRLDKLENENKALKGREDRANARTPLPAGVVAPPGALPELSMAPAGLVPPPLPPAVPLPVLPPATRVGTTPPAVSLATPVPAAGVPASGVTPPKSGFGAPAPATTSLPPLADSPNRSRRVFEAPVDKQSKAGDLGLEKVASSAKYVKNTFAGYMPPGFASAVLLHGVSAGTSATTQANPIPVLIRIQDHAVLPGAAKYDVKTCFVLGSAVGNLSSERVDIRLAKLSCVDKTRGLVLDQPVQGYVVDTDGGSGMRAKLVDRQGSRLGKAMLAGFGEGLASVYSGASQSTSTSAIGTVTSSIASGDAFKVGGFNGASSALTKMADMYMKQAEALFPVLDVDVGRTATVVFSEGVSLIWNDASSALTKDVKPGTLR